MVQNNTRKQGYPPNKIQWSEMTIKMFCMTYLNAINGGLAIDRGSLLGLPFGTCLPEGLEDRVRVVKVVVHDVHQGISLHHLVDQFMGRRIVFVQFSPLSAELIGFVLPRHEADRLDDRGLDDLFPREHTPGHSVRSFRVRIGLEITTLVDGIVSDVRIPFNMIQQELQEVRVHEELQIGLVIVD